MKVQNVILLRRKYISYLFELADKNFPNNEQLNSAVEEFKVLTVKDSDLIKAQNRLLGLKDNLTEDMELLDSMAKYNAKSMKETSQLKQNLSKKLNNINKDYEANYRDMNDLYQGIIVHNASIMLNKLQEDNLFKKMQQAILTTDSEFLIFCENFKKEEINKHQSIQLNIQKTLQLLSELNTNVNDYIQSNTELKLNHLNMAMKMRVKNSKIQIINITKNLQTIINNHIILYPETLKFRVNEINDFVSFIDLEPSNETKENIELTNNTNELDLITETETILNKEKIITNVFNIQLNFPLLLKIQEKSNKIIPYFEESFKDNEKILLNLIEEKDKILKAAIPFETLTIKAARQWLELNEKGWFAITKNYIINHPLATTHMNMSLLD